MSLFYQGAIINARGFSFLLIIPLLGLFTIPFKGVIGAWVDPGLTNLSRRDVYERNEIGFFPDENKDDEALIRKEKALRKNPITKRISMLFKDKDRGIDEKLEDFKYPGPYPESPDAYTSTDFIVRLQEKYEYQTCEQYYSVTTKEDYFQFDESLVNPKDGDPAQVEEKLSLVKKTLKHRYRMFGEPCNHKNEWQFWHDMFNMSEHDIMTGDNGIIDPDAEFVRVPQTEMIRRWDYVWKNYETAEVCNQRLLLECIPEYNWTSLEHNEGKFICGCRRNAVGLMTIFNTGNIRTLAPSLPSYTIQYYYDNKNLVNEVESGNLTSPYKHGRKCVMTSSLPYIAQDVDMISPCDFFLPMIGMCRTECVENATCIGVDSKTLEDTEDAANPDLIIRVKEQRSHSKYYNECVCKPGMHCTNIEHADFSGGERLGVSIGGSFLSLLLSLFWDKLVMPQII